MALDSLRPRTLARALSACALLSLLGHELRAQSLPSGATVVHGQARIATTGNRMTVTNTPGAVIDWRSFSIGTGQGVHFDQASNTSQVLNRVTGNDPSQILGSLSSNGRVWLLNPNGVLFGQNARIDVAGLVASTLSLNNGDWLAGRYRLVANPGDGPGASVVNQGDIRTPLGGRVALLGGQVKNEGLITTPGGQILLAAGQQVDLVDTGAPNVQMRVSAPQGEVLNLGTLGADGGFIDVQAAIVNQRGIVRADGHGVDAAGRPVLRAAGNVSLKASETLLLDTGSSTSAAGTAGGGITVDGGSGINWVRGLVDATGTQGVGGQVKLLGRQIGLDDGARVDVSGATGGGSLMLGGGLQGRDAGVPNAEAVYLAPGAHLAADATAQGSGGRIILWSDRSTRAYGSLSARGGLLGGDGGFIETSGGWLDARPAVVDTAAPLGRPGTWLLDPYNILITGTTSVANTGAPTFTPTADNSTIAPATISAALSAGNNVVITTGGAAVGGAAGDILVTSAVITSTSTSGNRLTLEADRNILVTGSTIQSTAAPLSVTLQSGRSGRGRIGLTGSTLRSNGGDISLGGFAPVTGPTATSPWAGAIGYDAPAGDATGYNTGVVLASSQLLAGSGSIDVSGNSIAQTPGIADGIRLEGASLAGRVIRLDGWTDSSTSSFGIWITGSSNSINATQSLLIDGRSVRDLGVIMGNGLAQSGGGLTLSAQSGPGKLSSIGSSFGLSSAGTLQLVADRIGLSGPLTSSATGDAIIVRGQSTGGLELFAGLPNVTLTSPGARWLVYAASPATFGSSVPSSLNYAFKQYDVRFGEPNALTPATGNGVLFALAPQLVVSAAPGTLQKTYDGSVGLPSGVTATLGFAGLQAGDVATAPGLGLQFADKNVGVDKPLVANATPIVQDAQGRPVFGYRVSYDLRGTITPAALTITAANAQKTFFATVSFAGTEFTSTGLVGSEAIGQVTLLSDGAAASAQVRATPYAIVASNATGGSFDPRNYSIVYVDGALTVVPKDLVAALGSIVGNPSKVYDGSTRATLAPANFSLTGFAGTDGAVVTQTEGRYDSANAGNRTVTATLDASQFSATGQTNLGNYRLPTTVSGPGTITTRPVEITGIVADNKVYDGSTSASIGVARFGNLVAGETLTLNNAIARFDTKDAGTAKPVIVEGGSLGDGSGLAANYRLVTSDAVRFTTLADITPRSLNLAGVSAASREYDGTINANLTGGTLDALVAGEALRLSLAGQFADKDAGQSKPVSVVAALQDGTDGSKAGNYRLAAVNPVVADILPRTVTLTAPVTAADRTYNGGTGANLSFGPLGNLVGDERVVAQADGRFDTKDAGTGKTVTVGAISLVGQTGLASNYRLQTAPGGPLSTTASITPKPLSIADARAQDKTYDGDTNAVVTGRLDGLVGNEQLSANFAGRFADKNAGDGKLVTVQAQVGDGAAGGLASNYRAPAAVSVLADIDPAALVVSAANASKTYGTTRVFAGTEFTAQGLVNGERIDRVTLSSAGAAPNASVVGGPYAIDVREASGSGFLAANYDVRYQPGQLSVTQAPLTAGIVGLPNKVFDGLDRVALTPANFSVAGFAAGEGATVNQGSGRFDSADPGARVVTADLGAASLVTLGATDLRNYSVPLLVTGAGSIAPRPPAEQAQLAVPLANAVQLLSIPPARTSATEGRALDAVQAVGASSSRDSGVSFQTISVSGMSMDALAALLASREQLKRNLFSRSLDRLAQDPKLADVGDCNDVAQLVTGNCMITDKLRAELAAARRAAAEAYEAEEKALALMTQPARSSSSVGLPAPAAGPKGRGRGEMPAKRKVVKSAIPQISRKIAYVIGIDSYADKSIPSLDNAARDARAVGSLLGSTLGYEVTFVGNATKEEIIAGLNRLAGEVDADDSVVIYYAGHGAVVEATGLGYWQPANALADKPETWISNSDINKLVSRIGASQVALISDSCFSGSLISGQRIRASADLIDPAKVLSQKSVVIMTSGGNEPVFDSGKDGHSPFAWNLMRSLERIPSWQAGSNVFERVRFAVAREMPQKPQYAAITEAGHQQGGDFLFEQRELEAGAPRPGSPSPTTVSP